MGYLENRNIFGSEKVAALFALSDGNVFCMLAFLGMAKNKHAKSSFWGQMVLWMFRPNLQT